MFYGTLVWVSTMCEYVVIYAQAFHFLCTSNMEIYFSDCFMQTNSNSCNAKLSDESLLWPRKTSALTCIPESRQKVEGNQNKYYHDSDGTCSENILLYNLEKYWKQNHMRTVQLRSALVPHFQNCAKWSTQQRQVRKTHLHLSLIYCVNYVALTKV